jgi:hypothetical protein
VKISLLYRTICEWSRDADQKTLARLHYNLEVMASEQHQSYDPEVVAEKKEKAEAFIDVLTGELRRIYDL